MIPQPKALWRGGGGERKEMGGIPWKSRVKETSEKFQCSTIQLERGDSRVGEKTWGYLKIQEMAGGREGKDVEIPGRRP